MSELFKRGQRISDVKASDLQRLVDTANDYRKRFTVSPPLKVFHAQGGGVHLTYEGTTGFWAKIIAVNKSTGACAWEEVVAFADGTFQTKTDGRTSGITTNNSPAFEANGNKAVPTPIYVWLEPGWQHTEEDSENNTGQEYLFELKAASSFILVDSDQAETVNLGRNVTDGVLVSGSNVLESVTAKFTSADVGSTILDKNNGIIPENTTISSVTDAAHVLLNNNATGDSKSGGDTIGIVSGTVQAYSAYTVSWINSGGANTSGPGWNTSQTFCWWYDNNQYVTPIPMPPSGYILEANEMTTDVWNVPIFGGGPYYGATGTDPNGNIFVDGWCVNVGGAVSSTISGGNFW